ncbi:MAG TPA: PIG-L deacetylase family protein [Acidimicrobiales bacterium]|nr:PIG-L deacetylase family protein [Acidimicrobiales bacterium]
MPLERILVVAAHPDDIDFAAAGSVATWTAQGVDVSYCVVTDGDAGGFDPGVPRSEIPAIRQAEQTAAAATVGVHDVQFLSYPDGRLQPSLELRRDISRVIRRVRPQRVVSPSPVRDLKRIPASHPDHLATGESAINAVYPDARNPFAFPELLAEGLEPWTVDEIWLMATSHADVHVDITEEFDRKMQALRCHESQLADPAATEERIRGWGTMVAQRMGLPEGRLAEGFLHVPASF